MTQLLHLIIFGQQGSGKGTQARALSRRYGLAYLGLGELFRELAEENSPTGQRVRNTINAGRLLPDPVTNQLVSQKLGNIPPAEGFILDGYPRNLQQAEALHQTLRGLGRLVPRPIFLNLEMPRERLFSRLEKRHKTERRADDTAEAIANRLEIYDRETHPILKAVVDWADVVSVNGDQTVEKVTDELVSVIGRSSGHAS